MKRWIIALLMIVGIMAPWSIVRAQNAPEIEKMQIDLWPEYDKPEVLVIFRITLAATPNMPVQINLKIPKASNGPASLAMKGVDGFLYNLKYDQVEEGDWIRISFTAPATEIQLEYYDPGLNRNGTERRFTFHWPGDYRVRSMLLRIQQPVNASSMQMVQTPLKMDAGTQADDGLVYYNVPIDGAVEAGIPFNATFSYTKPDSTLSSSQTPVQPVRTVPGSSAALNNGLNATNNYIWMGIAVGLILILIGLFWFFKQQRASPAFATANRRRHAYAPHEKATALPASSNGAIYCHQCGKRANSGDTFCRSCGVKLKTE